MKKKNPQDIHNLSTTLHRGVADTSPPAESAKPVVLFNGLCSLCKREIGWYRKLDSQRRALVWQDLHKADMLLKDNGLTIDKAVQQLHIILPDHSVRVGVDAFRYIWLQIPQLKPLAWLVAVPGIYQIFTYLYELWLKHYYLKRFSTK